MPTFPLHLNAGPVARVPFRVAMQTGATARTSVHAVGIWTRALPRLSCTLPFAGFRPHPQEPQPHDPDTHPL